MAFEWDPSKARTNFRKHGVRFPDAFAVFEDDRGLTIPDLSSSEEERWITLGIDSLGRLLAVVYTWRSETVRIISARLASPRETKQYEVQNET